MSYEIIGFDIDAGKALLADGSECQMEVNDERTCGVVTLPNGRFTPIDLTAPTLVMQ